MKILYLVFIGLFMSLNSFGQSGGVIENKDPLIDSLIARRIELLNTANSSASAPISSMGYRVQIFYGSDRREVFDQQAKFRNNNPKTNTYITYNAPNYYLRVGDFPTRLEAQRLMNELRPTFPTLFIFREKINLSLKDPSNNDQK